MDRDALRRDLEAQVEGEVRFDKVSRALYSTDASVYQETPLPGHLGLATITERAELAGGWCRVNSRPSEGSIIECWMPLGATVESEA